MTQHHEWPRDAGLVIESYREDQRGALLRTLLVSTGLLSAGCLLSLLSSAFPGDERTTCLFPALCVAIPVLALTSSVLGLARALARERFIVLRSDGLVSHDRGADTFISWDDLRDMRATDCGRFVELRLENGDRQVISVELAGMSAERLASRIGWTRARVALGLGPKARRGRCAGLKSYGA